MEYYFNTNRLKGRILSFVIHFALVNRININSAKMQR